MVSHLLTWANFAVVDGVIMNECPIRVVMLCSGGRSSRIVFNELRDFVDITCVIIEDKQSSVKLIKRRIKKLGLMKSLGQLSFIAFNKTYAKSSEKRIKKLMEKYKLSDEVIPTVYCRRVASVNEQNTIDLLKNFQPDAVLVNGTRIIHRRVLDCIPVPFINTHMGITPKYRGVHGGYWALANKDSMNCGVTVHLVDSGIDTGGILYQDIIHPEVDDNFNTYPIHQLAKALPLIKRAMMDIKNGNLSVITRELPTKLWHHPTILEYIITYFRLNVK